MEKSNICLFHSLNVFCFRTSNAHSFLICERKRQVLVSIFLVRTWQIFMVPNYLGLLKGLLKCFVFAFSAPLFQWVWHCMYPIKSLKKWKEDLLFFGKYQIYFIMTSINATWLWSLKFFFPIDALIPNLQNTENATANGRTMIEGASHK